MRDNALISSISDVTITSSVTHTAEYRVPSVQQQLSVVVHAPLSVGAVHVSSYTNSWRRGGAISWFYCCTAVGKTPCLGCCDHVMTKRTGKEPLVICHLLWALFTHFGNSLIHPDFSHSNKTVIFHFCPFKNLISSPWYYFITVVNSPTFIDELLM